MQIRDINKPINSKTLNETLAKKFGTRLDTDSFTLEQLQDARNKIRTKLSQIETNESFSGLPKNETYSKNKLFLDILNAAISERADVEESKDQDDDGDKDFADVQIARMVKSGMSKAAAIKKVKNKDYNESIVREGAEDKAELVMAAKDMVDRLTGWMEDTAEMQSESMLELADAIRDEMSQGESDSFVNTVKPALEQLYAAMETTRESLTAGVSMLTGEGGAPAPDMGAPIDDIPADVEPEEPAMEPTVDDEFGAAAPAAGGTDEAGRARRESRMYKKKAMLEQARRLGTILSKKK
jgi:hypothetical protein